MYIKAQFLMLCFLLVALVGHYQVDAFSFKVSAKVEECIFEEIEADISYTVMFQVTQGGFNDIDFTIITPDKRVQYQGQRETEGTKTFMSSVAGVYRFCFSNKMSSLTDKVVSFMVVKGETTPMTEYAKKGDVGTLERLIIALSDSVQAVKSEQNYFRMREAVHRNTAESTNRRVLWWSVFETFILIAMSVWQIYYLRRFFEVKRAV
ncbi:emp24/gp25L/p24 family protein [Cavenderia fasciculata]|uniref:Emp24/gp25L/p24 family protein n=1 Tax=Cavenderia fasciculata TaxID=261658 RepID=F4PQ98_CACFS|nr:emp24/gp25L/p24 family protein [Cavenderia fasciculata]EGG22561.1 emp24/gp25L/p24 family protein [Cavenderia fasciculata]|eukprot:XP_004360412.1 emp24/gp25L/p24 family protein [Cavenderia fasciculata]